MKDEFGDRMKLYEGMEAKRKFMPLLPIIIRLDGKNFSRWTKGLERPFDERFSNIMLETTRQLVETVDGCRMGYTQSDEITLVIYSDTLKSQVYFDGRIQKLVSVLASMATATFNSLALREIPEKAKRLALFDCRAWTVPTQMEASNAVLWRERDATKNSISMAAREFYSHSELRNKKGNEMQELLFQKGVNWNNYPNAFKRGTFIQRRLIPKEVPEGVEERTDIRVLKDMPSFGKVSNRVGVIFDGEDPKLSVI